MGVEKPRLDALWPLHQSDPKFVPASIVVSVDGTPNQRHLGAACALGWSRLRGEREPYSTQKAALVALNALFTLESTYGHQCLSKNTFDGNEQGACDPHSYLWGAAMASTMAEAQRQKLVMLLDTAVNWWAEHMALCREFWTPTGVIMPCARAIPTAGHGQGPVHPSFVWDSRAYALIMLGEDGEAAKKRYGNIPPPAENAFQILRDCAFAFPLIRQRASNPLLLATPIRRWGGPTPPFAAAYAEDSPAIDSPAGWVVVAADSTFSAGKLLKDFKAPTGLPVYVGGKAPLPVIQKPPAPPGATIPPQPAANPATKPEGLWSRLVAWLRGL